MVIAYIKRLDLSKIYTVEVNQKRTLRAIHLNKLYWLWMTCIESETGTNRMDLHEYFKLIYFTPEFITVFGTEIPVRTTTAKDTKKFKEYLDKIQIFVSTELGIDLPDPEDKKWDEFYNYYSDRL